MNQELTIIRIKDSIRAIDHPKPIQNVFLTFSLFFLLFGQNSQGIFESNFSEFFFFIILTLRQASILIQIKE